VKQFVAAIVAALLISACTGSRVEEGLFFPTWRAEGAIPSGIVQGTLVEDDHCLYVETGNQRTLVAWEDGMGFEDATLLDTSGSPMAQVGEMIHGGGGYFGRASRESAGRSSPVALRRWSRASSKRSKLRTTWRPAASRVITR
jgi:hypothetical protein